MTLFLLVGYGDLTQSPIGSELYSACGSSSLSLPLFLWLMLAGTFVARPIAGFSVPPVILIVLEGVIFKTNLVLEFIEIGLDFGQDHIHFQRNVKNCWQI